MWEAHTPAPAGFTSMVFPITRAVAALLIALALALTGSCSNVGVSQWYGGETQVLATATLGVEDDAQRIDFAGAQDRFRRGSPGRDHRSHRPDG